MEGLRKYRKIWNTWSSDEKSKQRPPELEYECYPLDPDAWGFGNCDDDDDDNIRGEIVLLRKYTGTYIQGKVSKYITN
jgi:hypothetical protein